MLGVNTARFSYTRLENSGSGGWDKQDIYIVLIHTFVRNGAAALHLHPPDPHDPVQLHSDSHHGDDCDLPHLEDDAPEPRHLRHTDLNLPGQDLAQNAMYRVDN